MAGTFYSHNTRDITPQMTSENTPSPCIVSTTSEDAGQEGWKAFTHTTNDGGWQTGEGYSGAHPASIIFDLGEGNAKSVSDYTLTSSPDASKSWSLYGSNNNTDWTLLDSQSSINFGMDYPNQDDPAMISFNIASPASYRYYKITETLYDSYGGFAEIELIEEAGNTVITPDPLAATPLLNVSDVFLGSSISPDPLAASPGLSAGLRVDLAVPELAAAAALSGGLLVSIPADLGVVAEMSVVALSSFGSSDFIITYLCRLTPKAGSVLSEIILPMSSFQGRFKSGDPSFLSVIVPGGDYALAISDRNDPDDPPELSVYMVKTFINGNVISERLMAVDLEDVRVYEGATNTSIELEGHRTVTYSPKAVTLSGASYKNYSAGKLRYRCEPDLYLRPGDVVTVDGETFTADNISIAMAVNAQTMEVAES